jgi:hypothetical protein
MVNQPVKIRPQPTSNQTTLTLNQTTTYLILYNRKKITHKKIKQYSFSFLYLFISHHDINDFISQIEVRAKFIIIMSKPEPVDINSQYSSQFSQPKDEADGIVYRNNSVQTKAETLKSCLLVDYSTAVKFDPTSENPNTIVEGQMSTDMVIDRILIDLMYDIYSKYGPSCFESFCVIGSFESQFILGQNTNRDTPKIKRLQVKNTKNRFWAMALNINNSHWVALAYDKLRNMVHVFNSLNSPVYNTHINDKIKSLQSLGIIKEGADIRIHTVLQQDDGWKCGYHVLVYILKLCLMGPVHRENFFNETMDRMRFKFASNEYVGEFVAKLVKVYESNMVVATK